MVVKIFLDIHQKTILQKLNIKAVGDKLSNYLSDFNLQAISMTSVTYSKNLLMYPPPKTKIFEISPKMICFGGKRWEKLWIRWNWPFRVNLSLILGEKIEKYAKMAVLTQSKPLFWPNLPLWVIFSRIGVKWFEKVGKLKKFANVPPQKRKFLRFLQKWYALVAKDGKSCELGEIGHSESISASFWGKR